MENLRRLPLTNHFSRKLRPLDGPIVDQMPPRVPIIPSPEAGQASRAHARGVIERNPKIASAPASNAAAESRLETAPVPAVPVPPPDTGLPKDIALPKPLGGESGAFRDETRAERVTSCDWSRVECNIGSRRRSVAAIARGRSYRSFPSQANVEPRRVLFVID